MQRTSSTDIRNRRNAFTLIELLVVIAIISLLAAILFPVFSSARDRARLASCTSNLKQVYTALRMYNQDYDGRYPDPTVLKSSLYRAVDDQYSMPHVIRDYTKSRNIWFCPSQHPSQIAREHPYPGYYWTVAAKTLKTPDLDEDVGDDGQFLVMENNAYEKGTDFEAATGATGLTKWPNGKKYCAHVGGSRYNYLALDGHVKLWRAGQSASLCAQF